MKKVGFTSIDPLCFLSHTMTASHHKTKALQRKQNADHDVRKYDDEIGRFTSIDPLWEKYYSLIF